MSCLSAGTTQNNTVPHGITQRRRNRTARCVVQLHFDCSIVNVNLQVPTVYEGSMTEPSTHIAFLASLTILQSTFRRTLHSSVLSLYAALMIHPQKPAPLLREKLRSTFPKGLTRTIENSASPATIVTTHPSIFT